MPQAESSTARAPRSPTRRAGDWLSGWPEAARLLLVLGIAATVIGRTAMGTITNYFTDDAYYYAGLARNLAAGLGWTFDGVTTTNGAHPLLLALEVLVAKLVGPKATPLEYFRALVVMFGALHLAFVAALAWWTRPAARGDDEDGFVLALWLAVGALYLPEYLKTTAVGMESSVAFPLAVLFLLAWYRGHDVAAGLAGGALAMARLDTAVFFLAPLALVRLAAALRSGEGLRAGVRSAALLVAPAAVLLAAYLAYNGATFGQPMPIHAVLKSSFPWPRPQLFQLLGPPAEPLAQARSLHVQGHYVFLAALLALAWLRPLRSRHGLLALSLLLVAAIQQANFALFQKWSKATPEWYLWLPLLAGLLAFFLGAVRALPARATAVAGLALGLALGLLGAMDSARTALYTVRYGAALSGFWHHPDVDYLLTQPEGEVWAATDCGRQAFWSGRRIVDLDGLISGFELQDRIARGELREYLREVGVTRVLVRAWDRLQASGREYEPMYRSYVNPDAFLGTYEAFPFFVYSHRDGVYSDTLLLRRDQETWRSPEYRDGRGFAHTLAFDLRRGE